MNIKERLLHIAHVSNQDRMLGRTTLIAKAAKDLGGIVLAHNHYAAKQIERAHGVIARSMEVNLFGFSGPFFLDHHATEQMFLKAANKIHDLEVEKKALQEKFDDLKDFNHRALSLGLDLTKQVEDLQKKLADTEAAALILNNRLEKLLQENKA